MGAQVIAGNSVLIANSPLMTSRRGREIFTANNIYIIDCISIANGFLDYLCMSEVGSIYRGLRGAVSGQSKSCNLFSDRVNCRK